MNEAELRSLLGDGGPNTVAGRIVRILSEYGALSATQIARISWLAKSTVSTALSELRRSGMVVESSEAEGRAGGVGRPATLLTLNPQAGTCVGILVGFDHIQVIVADVSHAVLFDESVQVDDDYSPEHAVEQVRGLVAKAYDVPGFSKESLLGVGIAVGSPVNPTSGRVLRAGGVPTWAGIDIRTIFEPDFDRPVFADNESNCAAIAEMTWGAAVGHEDFVLYTIDLGVGGAIVSHGQVLTGVAGAAGEFGHISIEPEGPLCRCGNRGCLELYASFKEPLALAERRYGPITIEEVAKRARDGDIGCRRLIEDTAEAAGRGLGIITATLNPGLIVIAGRLVHAGSILMDALARSYDRHSLVKSFDVGEGARTRLVPTRFAGTGACMGAVGLVLRHHGRLQ
jgi:predicted NBD/HSP70 family sugar kinase